MFHETRESFSHSEFKMPFLQTLCQSVCLLWSDHSTIKHRWVKFCSDSWASGTFSHLQDLCSSPRMTIGGSWSRLQRPFSLDCSVQSKSKPSETSRWFSNSYHIRLRKEAVLLDTSISRLCLDTVSYLSYFWSHSLVFLSSVIHFTQVDSNQLEETSKNPEQWKALRGRSLTGFTYWHIQLVWLKMTLKLH